MNWVTARLLGAGVVLGTVGVKVLTSEDAKKVYTHVTAAALRCSDEVMKVYDSLKENCGDITADAKEINEKRAEEKEAKLIADAKALLAAYEKDED